MPDPRGSHDGKHVVMPNPVNPDKPCPICGEVVHASNLPDHIADEHSEPSDEPANPWTHLQRGEP